MADEKDILLEISRVVARGLDADEGAELADRLKGVLASAGMPAEKLLEQSCIYEMYAEKPGYPENGRPGYLSSDVNPKDAILDELKAMREADFDREEHAKAWQSLMESIESASAEELLPGASINCPDDYLLTLKKVSCAEILRSRHINLD